MNHYFHAWKNFTNFKGRARRAEYWQFFAFNFVFSLGIAIFCAKFRIPLVNALFTLATLIPSMAVAIRRMHDTGKSGWYVIVPIYNFILALTPGVHGDNHWGPDPKGGSKPNDGQSKVDVHHHEHQRAA